MHRTECREAQVRQDQSSAVGKTRPSRISVAADCFIRWHLKKVKVINQYCSASAKRNWKRRVVMNMRNKTEDNRRQLLNPSLLQTNESKRSANVDSINS